MKKIFLFSILLFMACQSDKNKPSPFIEQQKMEDILYDVSLLYGIQSTNSFARDSVQQFDMNAVLNKYGVDSLTFAVNNRYYVELKKGVYYDMQKRIMERLETVKTEIDSLVGKDEEKELQLEKMELAPTPIEAKPAKDTEQPVKKEAQKNTDLKKIQMNPALRQRVLKINEEKAQTESQAEKPHEVQTQNQ